MASGAAHPWTSTSASQVESWNDCNRKWFYRSILKILEPPTPSTERGGRVHKVLETLQETGTLVGDPEALAIVEPGLHLLPSRGPELLLEHEFRMDTFQGGPSWLGYIDLFDPRGGLHVVDYKTLSDQRYCKTPEDLKASTQMNAYARWALCEGSGWAGNEQTPVKLSHIYFITRRPHKSHVVSAMTTRAEVSKIWNRDMATVKKMAYWAEKRPETAEPLEPNTASCDKYGGCAYRRQCGFVPKGISFLTGAKKMETGNGNGKMSLSERLKAKQAEAAFKVISAPEVAPPNPLAATILPGPVATMTGAVGIVPPDAPSRDEILTAPEQLELAVDPPKKRGRPKKEATPDGGGSLAPEVLVKRMEEFVGLSPRKTFELWVDTIAVKGSQAVMAEDWIRPFVENVCESNGVQDPRLMPYGAGKVAVANVLRAHVHEVPSVLLVNSMSPYAHELIEVLTPYASRVMRALRG